MLTSSYINKFQGTLPTKIDFDTQTLPTQAVLGPNTETYTPGSRISEEEYYKLLKNEMTMLMLGWADYDDVFPDTARHRTEFCFQILLVAQADGGTRIALPRTSHLDGFDEECQNLPRAYSRLPFVG
jgi:hypothetical protein